MKYCSGANKKGADEFTQDGLRFCCSYETNTGACGEREHQKHNTELNTD